MTISPKLLNTLCQIGRMRCRVILTSRLMPKEAIGLPEAFHDKAESATGVRHNTIGGRQNRRPDIPAHGEV
jgi:hypothetical protein